MQNSDNIAKGILSQSWNITMGFLQAIIVFIAVITIIFYLLKDSTYMKSKFLEFFPEKLKDRADDIFTIIRIAREFSLKLTLDHCTEGALIADELRMKLLILLFALAKTDSFMRIAIAAATGRPVRLSLIHTIMRVIC